MALFSVIKYEGTDADLVWRHPAQDFNTLSQLIVYESQEAVLYKNGQALDVFAPGRHTLATMNIPLLNKLINLPFGGESPFQCWVYFIRKDIPLDIKWGTNSQIQVFDPKFGIIIHAGASGGFGVQIVDSKKFLVKLVGTRGTFDKDTLVNYFREIIVTRVKNYLTALMSEVNFVVVNSHLEEMSQAMHAKLREDLAEYGVDLVNFFVSTIQLQDEDYQEVQKALSQASVMGIMAEAERKKTMVGAEAERYRMDTVGYNWADEHVAEIMRSYAGNPGQANSVAGMVAQTPLAFAFGNILQSKAMPMVEQAAGAGGFSQGLRAFGGVSANAEQQAAQPPQPAQTPPAEPEAKDAGGIACPKCGQPSDQGARFCSLCGAQMITKRFCTGCGAELDSKAVFCPKCGVKQQG